MKKIVQTALIAACLMGAGAAQAQLGGLGSLGGMLGGKKSAGGDIGAEVGSFVTQSQALGLLASSSVTAINAAFASDEQRASKAAELAAINKLTNPDEQKARTAKLYESEAAEAKRLLESGEMKDRMATLDSAKKKQIGDALMNFGIGGLQAVVLTKTGQSLIQKASADPMSLPKLLPVKDTLPLLGKVAADAGGFMVGVMKVAKGANIEVREVSASSKAEVIAF
jgi:hypothetical protein